MAGVGGAPDVRNRSAEFAERGPISKEELLCSLEAVVEEAKRVLVGVNARQLTEVQRIQGFDVTGVTAKPLFVVFTKVTPTDTSINSLPRNTA